ncbi:hypothetical protein B0O44_103200 [Pedobacter nutrimenti]|uniref:Outer membrane receptor protein involved in Fe transport n=2 Tax=Pedobacter nutrimenti TaxID=1241337 RepID=A0A318UEC7_9SPHI|nr:hypothetical protein B0O44_103200 [Pedobacter nutrimenti]
MSIKVKLKYWILLLFFMGKSISVSAQNRMLSGKVTDLNSTLLSNVNISLRNGKNLILRSLYTNENGAYALLITDSLSKDPTLFLQATYLGFKKKQIQLKTNKSIYDFLLEIDPVELSEVNIKNKPTITKRGDTLSYSVNSFARNEDRSIGDVLKHLPGVIVGDDGKISFNGQPISNLFIGGDDLMGGRYGLATRSISKDLIKNIEVLKNHQPIKVLEDKILTNNIAMNLVLKDENSLKLSGEGMLGAGVPSQFDAALNLIALNKRLKMLNSAKTNNSGIDYRSDFKDLSSDNSLISNHFSKPEFLTSNGTTGAPDLPRKNYYDNKSAVINLNNLVNTKKGLQMRFNVQGFTDQNSLAHTSKVANYLPGDTIIFNERQTLTQKTNLINTGFSVSKNDYRVFFNNTLNFNVKHDQYLSPLNFNGLGFNQRLTNQAYDFSNNFSYIPKLKNSDIIILKWNVNYFSNPQRLFIDEGINPEVMNNNTKYNGLTQNVKIPVFFSDVSSNFIIPDALVKQNYQIGISNEFKQLNSNIRIFDTDPAGHNYPNDAGNALNWQSHKFYINASYSLKTDIWQLSLSSPLQLQLVRYNQPEYQIDKKTNQLSVGPYVNVNLKTGDENYINADLSYVNNMGDVNSVYRGSILTNYRTLQNNDADLQVKKNLRFGLKYHLEKSIDLAFSNIGINFSQIMASSIAFTLLSDNIQQTVLVPVKNNSSRLSVHTDFSKYFFLLKGKIELSANYSKLKTNLYLNNQLLPYFNNNLILNFGYDTKLANVISLNYNLAYGYTEGGQKNEEFKKFNFTTTRFDQYLTLTYSPTDQLSIEANAQQIINRQQENLTSRFFLMNSNLRYKLFNNRIDLGLEATNLFNTKNYTTSSISSSQLQERIYNIRGTMVILRVIYIL